MTTATDTQLPADFAGCPGWVKIDSTTVQWIDPRTGDLLGKDVMRIEVTSEGLVFRVGHLDPDDDADDPEVVDALLGSPVVSGTATLPRLAAAGLLVALAAAAEINRL